MSVGLLERLDFPADVGHRATHVLILDHELLALLHVLGSKEQLELTLHLLKDRLQALFDAHRPLQVSLLYLLLELKHLLHELASTYLNLLLYLLSLQIHQVHCAL